MTKIADYRQNDKFRDSYNIFTISLNGELGNHRKTLLNFDTEIFEGYTYDNAPQFIKDKFRFWKVNGVIRRSLQAQHGAIGCFASHYLCMKKIVNEKIDMAIICEDDAFQKAYLPNPDIFTEATLLGTFIFHPKSWERNNKWVRETMPEVMFSWQKNIVDIDYEVFRWRGLHAYLFPKWQDAKKITDFIEQQEKLQAIDILLPNNKLIKKLHYPAIFGQNLGLLSQIDATINIYNVMKSIL